MTDIIMGDVDNGTVSEIAFPFYSGTAGVRDRDGYIEVAFFPPSRLMAMPKIPAIGTMDGDPVRAIHAEKGQSGGNAIILKVVPNEI